MSIIYEKCTKIIDYLKSVEISVKNDFLHADKQEGFIFKPINEKDKDFLYIVKQDGVVSGAVVVREILKEDYKMFKNFVPKDNSFIIDKLVIKSWHRNLGLGYGLIKFITEQFKNNNLYAIARVSPQSFVATHKILNKLNFVKVQESKFLNKDYNDEAVWALYELEQNKID